MSYRDVLPDELTLRDCLARDRTVMANERTLLAYLRTGLMLIVSGVTIYKLLPHEGPVVMGLAWVLFVAGVGTLTFGGRRFWQQRRRLADIR